jgi:hypothetical protein
MRRRSYFVLAVLAFAGLTMGQDDGCSEFEEEEPEVEKEGGGSAEVASVGDKMTLKGTTYRVTKVGTAQVLGESEFDRVKANGRFVIVSVCLTNRKNEPATILDDNMRLIAGNDKNYSTSDDALFTLADQSFLLEEIQPDVRECGKLVYDVPKRVVSGSKLEVTDLFSDSKGQIRLGL